MVITVTPAQAKMIADAQAVVSAALRDLTIITSAVSAGSVPDGSQLVSADIETGVLTFHVAQGATDAD